MIRPQRVSKDRSRSKVANGRRVGTARSETQQSNGPPRRHTARDDWTEKEYQAPPVSTFGDFFSNARPGKSRSKKTVTTDTKPKLQPSKAPLPKVLEEEDEELIKSHTGAQPTEVPQHPAAPALLANSAPLPAAAISQQHPPITQNPEQLQEQDNTAAPMAIGSPQLILAPATATVSSAQHAVQAAAAPSTQDFTFPTVAQQAPAPAEDYQSNFVTWDRLSFGTICPPITASTFADIETPVPAPAPSVQPQPVQMPPLGQDIYVLKMQLDAGCGAHPNETFLATRVLNTLCGAIQQHNVVTLQDLLFSLVPWLETPGATVQTIKWPAQMQMIREKAIMAMRMAWPGYY